MAAGESIKVSFYAEIPPPPEATKPSAGTIAQADPAPGSIIDFSWTQYQGCPAGHPLSGFSVSVNGGTLVQANPQGAGASSVQIQLPATPGSVSVFYTALCTDFDSPPSDPVSVTSH